MERKFSSMLLHTALLAVFLLALLAPILMGPAAATGDSNEKKHYSDGKYGDGG